MSNKPKIGWIGAGRMGTPMIERLLKAGHDVTIWNRTRAKAEPLSAKGGKLVDKPAELASCEVVFAIVSTGKDVEEVLFGKDGLLSGGAKPKMVVDCSSISVEESAAIRKRLQDKGVSFIAAPVSGNAKVIKAASCRRGVGPGSRRQDCDAADRSVRAAGRFLTWATASSRASARSRTTSCSAW